MKKFIWSILKGLFYGCLLGAALMTMAFLKTQYNFHTEAKKAPEEIRNYVVMLEGNNHECSGVLIKGKLEQTYILTAGHCNVLLVDNKVKAIYEDKTYEIESLISEDIYSDLMLLTASKSFGLKIGGKVKEHEKVHTVTHGARQPAFKTEGELLDTSLITIPIYKINDADDLMRCALPKYAVVPMPVFFSPEPQLYCALHIYETASTAWVTGGSSGGPVLNENDQVVGIVSAHGEDFSLFAPLKDITIFLKDF